MLSEDIVLSGTFLLIGLLLGIIGTTIYFSPQKSFERGGVYSLRGATLGIGV